MAGMYMDHTPEIRSEMSLQIRQEVCYHCTGNSPNHEPVVTEQWVKYFGDGLRAYECRICKQLISDSDFALDSGLA